MSEDNLKIGTIILYTIYNKFRIRWGVVRECSPSKKYIRIEDEWFDANWIFVQEVLGHDKYVMGD